MIPVHPVRRPLDGLSPYDTEAVQTWAVRRANEQILRLGLLRPSLVVFLDDHIAELDLLERESGDPVATVVALGERADVEHRLLFGCHCEDDQWIAWVFGAAHDDARSFWVALCPFEVQPGGLGSTGGSWEVAYGVGFSTVPFPANLLARPGPALHLLAARPPEPLRLGGSIHEIPAGQCAPRDPIEATDIVAQLGHEASAVQHGLDGVLVVLFRPTGFEQWHAEGEIPFGLDDLIRNLCRRGESPTAVVALSMCVFPHEGKQLRAVRMVSEASGQRFVRYLAQLWSEGDTDGPSQFQYFATPSEPVDRDGWIDVDPVTEITLTLPGADA